MTGWFSLGIDFFLFRSNGPGIDFNETKKRSCNYENETCNDLSIRCSY